jgi:3-hydroxyisobutyrate dehydrogenase-like beta-hydroxyacid dehydrogenase
MDGQVAVIGYGEAGRAFDMAGTWRAFDLLPERTRTASLAEALDGAGSIISLVTADQALGAAQAAAGLMDNSALYFDMNSVAPQTKRAAAEMIEASGGRYVDVAVMSPVHPKRLAVPLLVSGPHAGAALEALTVLGFSHVRAVGADIGRASTIKMLRSVMYKGMEALTAECLIACERAGVTEEVLGSFGEGVGSADWASGADYRLDRMMVHGLRRAAEMAESVKTLDGLGVEPLLTRGTVERERAIGALGIANPPKGLKAKLELLK